MNKIILFYSKFNKDSVKIKNQLLNFNTKITIEVQETTEKNIEVNNFKINNVPSIIFIKKNKIIDFLEKDILFKDVEYIINNSYKKKYIFF